MTTDDSHGGNKCIRVTRPNDYNANATDNTDTHIFSGFQVRDNAVFYMECWVKLDAKSTAMAENVQISVGLSLQYQDNSAVAGSYQSGKGSLFNSMDEGFWLPEINEERY
ncbi:hypothetical protein EAO28_03670 [Klebsiella pneumoniae]|uniref:Uncharacterized protein n=1 Tax=Klebsiella pneumoniae TaxID=573 RepID=A0A3P2EG51_KLEPN|nr:hypothetical protein EAO28_03670 [Klebsiella pneumoniae]